ncbi:TAXI family TRAP transporter solute-binding subunit [Planococcus salinus]|uniref:TAXI family TRAP transporter solute-binding subunit n=1 Tax=Planococcus salinus TaxID=1848460 RepID=A0A3M8P7R8_9BACL|nr:TAXI family TRAP transporter solute-binding subunit [Planococcus salinus]RNF39725.1 TAXI family TRAP transporter solute-binding subunit [Planococcus salinus]
MKKISNSIFFITLILIIGLLGACSEETESANSEANDSPAEKVSLKIATGNTSSAIYALGGGYAQAIEKHIPNANVTVVGSAGYGENAALLATGDADIATTSRANAETTMKDRPELVEELATLATGHQNLQHIVVAADSGINSVEELKGKKVSVGEPGSGTETVSGKLLEAYGLTYDDIEPAYISFAESVDELQNGRVDAILITTLLPNPGIMSIATQKDLKFIGMDAEHVEKLSKSYGDRFVESVIPAGTYEGQTEDVPTAGSPAAYVVNKDMDEDLAYELTKTFIEKADEIEKVHPAASQWTIENALLGLDFSYHPGAVKYYKEIGAWENRREGASE